MLKITRKGVSLIIPEHWIEMNGFLKHKAVHAVKLFFGDESLEKALKEAERNVKHGWLTADGIERKKKEEI